MLGLVLGHRVFTVAPGSRSPGLSSCDKWGLSSPCVRARSVAQSCPTLCDPTGCSPDQGLDQTPCAGNTASYPVTTRQAHELPISWHSFFRKPNCLPGHGTPLCPGCKCPPPTSPPATTTLFSMSLKRGRNFLAGQKQPASCQLFMTP